MRRSFRDRCLPAGDSRLNRLRLWYKLSPGLGDAHPITHIKAIELGEVPEHLEYNEEFGTADSVGHFEPPAALRPTIDLKPHQQ